MSTIRELPTINFDSYPGYDEFKFLHSTYSEEFKLRSLTTTDWGIVDSGFDPATAPFTSGRPLLVAVSPLNALTIDIAQGVAITKSRLLININAIIPSVPLPDLTAGKTYIVGVEYTLVPSTQQRINRFGDLTDVRLERPSNIPVGGGSSTLLHALTIVDINDYSNPSIFTTARKDNIVVIAIVNAQSDPTTGQIILNVDLTRNTYEFNRPWFSIRDVDHRSRIGSGVITDNNPHGLDLQDLSSAGLTLYQQLKSRGGILAKDSSYYGYAGKICTEEIILSRWEADTTGRITTRPGTPLIGGRYFVRLAKLPVRTGSLYPTGKPWEPIAYEWLEGTRIIVLAALESPANFTGSLLLEYFTVDALEVNAESPTQGLQTIQVKSPIPTQEIIVSGGLAISSLTQESLALPAVLGPIKRGYRVLCSETGTLVLDPQPLTTTILVADLVGTTKTLNQAVLNGTAVPLTIGLTRAIERTTVNATTTFDLNLKLQIIGVDKNGTSRVEVLTFKGSQWRDQSSVANVEEPMQFLRTTVKYQLINSIALTNTLSEPHNAGPDALLSIWAHPLSESENQEFASIASFFWTGTTALYVKDERVIATSLNDLDQKKSRYPHELPEENLSAVQELFSVLLTPPLIHPSKLVRRLILEKDNDRMWAETWREFSTQPATGHIAVPNIALVTIGQTIRIARNKYLKIVRSAANPAVGEVEFNSSIDIFKNNILITINDPLWDSTWFATLSTGASPSIVLGRAEAYPEGFLLNVRRQLTFLGLFTSGSFQLDVDSHTIGPVSFTTDNNSTILSIIDAINYATSATGVFAEVMTTDSGVYSTIILNGARDGSSFVVDNLLSINAPTGMINPLTDAFVLSQPSGGSLPTPHIPQRYPSILSPWVYLSRAIPWVDVHLEAHIQIADNNPAGIGNLDAVEIAPNKVVVARSGSGATADPTIGEFLVDTSSLTVTFNNLAATINHPLFASGIHAVVDDNKIRLISAGKALMTLKLLSAIVPSTWILPLVNGTPQYAPVGGGRTHLFLKTVYPLDVYEWRYVLVANYLDGWSDWQPMTRLSPTSFAFSASTPIYQFQFRLRGLEANNFSIYDYIPEVSGASLTILDTRLTEVESILVDAKGSTTSLNERISTVVASDGSRLQDMELTDARHSVAVSSTTSLKERLDALDIKMYYTSLGSSTPHGTSTVVGLPPQLVSGLMDEYDNSKFILELSTKVLVGGTPSFPLIAQVNGYIYKYARQLEVDFSASAPSLYYLYLEQATPYGLLLTAGSTNLTYGSSSITDMSANFVSAGVAEGCLLYIAGVSIAGSPLVLPISSVSTTSLSLAGTIPSTVVATSYQVYNPREGHIGFSTTKIVSTNKLYLGEVVWTGSAVSAINYRYLNRYRSPLVEVSAVGGSYTQVFAHNLGMLPSAFNIYFYDTVGSDPKLLHIGDEALVKTNKYTMTVRNRYSNLVARTFDGVAKTSGYLQLIV